MDQYEWDDAKNRSNREKHGVGFDLVLGFDWAGAVYRDDERSDYCEPRRLAYGFVGRQAVAIVFVVRGSRVRIISVRRMHAKEMRNYGLQAPS